MDMKRNSQRFSAVNDLFNGSAMVKANGSHRLTGKAQFNGIDGLTLRASEGAR